MFVDMGLFFLSPRLTSSLSLPKALLTGWREGDAIRTQVDLENAISCYHFHEDRWEKKDREERQIGCILFLSPRIRDVIGDALFYLPWNL